MGLESHERRALDHLRVAATTVLQLVLGVVVILGAAVLLALAVPMAANLLGIGSSD